MSLSRFQKLPFELIQSVIVTATIDDEGEFDEGYSRWSRDQLRLVSQGWKDIVDSSPELWHRVSSKQLIRETIASIERSREYPLHVCYDGTHFTAPRFLSLVVPHMHRWRHLEIMIDEDVDDLKVVWLGIAPILESIKIQTHDVDKVIGDITYDLLLGGAPRLHSIHILDVAFRLQSPAFHDLTTFVYYGDYDTALSAKSVMGVLGNSLRLETLLLCSLVWEMEDLGDTLQEIYLPSLRSILLVELPYNFINSFTQVIKTPNCQKFSAGWLDEHIESDGAIFQRDLLNGFMPWLSASTAADDPIDVQIYATYGFVFDISVYGPPGYTKQHFKFMVSDHASSDGLRWLNRIVLIATRGRRKVTCSAEVQRHRIEQDQALAEFSKSLPEGITLNLRG